MRRPLEDLRPVGPFTQGILEVRRKCEPEIVVIINEEMEDADEIIEASEKELRDNIGLQFDDIIVGIEPDEHDTVVTVRALRQEVNFNKVDQYVNFMKNNYNVKEVLISATREVRDSV